MICDLHDVGKVVTQATLPNYFCTNASLITGIWQLTFGHVSSVQSLFDDTEAFIRCETI